MTQESPRPVYAVDTETFYSKNYSVSDLGNYAYTHHPEFCCYLVSIVGSDGNKYVGHPKDFDWACISGAEWVSWNTGFDSAVIERLQELGVIPTNMKPSVWHDAADLAVYLGLPRSLKGAVESLFKIPVSKDVRDKMKGLSWESMAPEFQKEVTNYALVDSEHCLRVWLENSPKWPEWERRLSLHTREMCWRGLPVDIEGVDADVRFLEGRLWECRQRIPWADEEDAKILSPKAMAEECRKYGIAPPHSMAKDSEEFDLWLAEHGSTLPFAQAMSDYRRVNTLLLKFKTMQARTKPDGWMPYALKYFGGHTGRWSGDSGYNPQNLSRDPTFFTEKGIVDDVDLILSLKDKQKKGEPLPPEIIGFVDMRKRIKAPAGKKFVVCDLSNIEPRVIAVLSGDALTLQMLRTGADIYEAHARATMGYADPRPLKIANSELRNRSKTRVLGLGYGCGWLKFVTFAKSLLNQATYDKVFGVPVTPADTQNFVKALSYRKKDGAALLTKFKLMSQTEQRYWVNSYLQVEQFRKTNPKITDFWKFLEDRMRKICGSKELSIELPSGHTMVYRNPRNHGGLSAEIPRLGRLMRVSFHGGVLCENLGQGCARDVFGDCLIRLDDAAHQVVLHAHDEAVCLVDEDKADQALKEIEAIMSTPPSWMPTLPQAAEGHVCSVYTKA